MVKRRGSQIMTNYCFTDVIKKGRSMSAFFAMCKTRGIYLIIFKNSSRSKQRLVASSRDMILFLANFASA